MGSLTERLFVAVPIPPEVAAAVDEWRRPLALPGRPVPLENFHVTLRFVGDVEEPTRDRLFGALDEADWPRRFGIRLTVLGGFPNLRKATVAWIGIEGDLAALARTAACAEDAAIESGLGPEERPFHPHLTLARIRPPARLQGIEAPALGARISVRDIVVYRSHLGRGGVRYEAIERFSLRP